MYKLVISEIDESAATPLQAVKLLAMYLSTPQNKVITALIRVHETCCKEIQMLIWNDCYWFRNQQFQA